MLLQVLLPLAIAADPGEDPVAARVGVALSLDEHSPDLGVHVSMSNPAGRYRTGYRVDLRGWRTPTRDELAFWADQGVSGLPDHWEWELTASMGLRMTFDGVMVPKRFSWALDPGWELGIAAGYWHYATAEVQTAYADAGAVRWPLEEARIGPELLLGLFSPTDSARVVWIHRAYLPLHARLDGQSGRYRVGDQVFEPVEIVNPIYEAGLGGTLHRGSVFGSVDALYRLTMPSVKNRAVDQSPPDGTVLLIATVGWGRT